MKVSRCLFILVASLLSLSNLCAQQDSTKHAVKKEGNVPALSSESQLLEAKHQEKIDLEDAVSKLKELNSKHKADEKEIRKDITTIEKDIKTLQDKINKLKDSENYKRYVSLTRRIKKLEGDIELKEKDTLTLHFEIGRLLEKIADVNADKKSLNEIKGDVSKSLIQKHKPYLELPLSKMDNKQLSEIKAECLTYQADDYIKKFIESVDKTINAKSIYERAVESLKNKYDSKKNNAIVNELEKQDFNPAQRQEITLIISKLQKFEEGLNVFKEYISLYSKERTSIRSKRDHDETVEFILDQNDLKARVESSIKIIPYLESKWSEYNNELIKNIGVQPQVELEIIQQ